MTKALSLYLDALRFSAAFTVFVSHWAARRYSGGYFWRLMPLWPNSGARVFRSLGFRHCLGNRNQRTDLRGIRFESVCPALFGDDTFLRSHGSARPYRDGARSRTVWPGIAP